MASGYFDVHIIADYICWKFFKLDENISVAKLHKLLYFVQAWYLGREGRALFEDDFEAWIHGPVCPAIEARFKLVPKALPLTLKDINLDHLGKSMTRECEVHICTVLEHFGELSFLKLEEYFNEHELPWKEARDGVSSLARVNAIISKEAIKEFHQSESAEMHR